MKNFIRMILSISNTRVVGYIAFVMLFINWYVSLLIFGLNVLYVSYQWWTSYRPVINRINAVTGSAGTGKSPLITNWALVKYWTGFWSWVVVKYVFRNKNVQKPMIYSSEPILVWAVPFYLRVLNSFLPRRVIKVYDFKLKVYKDKHVGFFHDMWSCALTKEIVLLKESIPLNSVVVWYEIGASLNTKEYDNVYWDDIRLFLRFYKHFIDGWFFCDEQSVDDIPSVVRRKIGKFYLLSDFKRFRYVFPFNYIIEPFMKFGICNVNSFLSGENMLMSANGPTVEKNSELIHISFRRKYIDSYSHSEMYDTVPRTQNKPYSRFKSNSVLTIPTLSKKDYDRNPKLKEKNNLDLNEL